MRLVVIAAAVSLFLLRFVCWRIAKGRGCAGQACIGFAFDFLLFVVLVRPTGLCGLVVSERERGGRFGRARVAVPTPERKG